MKDPDRATAIFLRLAAEDKEQDSLRFNAAQQVSDMLAKLSPPVLIALAGRRTGK